LCCKNDIDYFASGDFTDFLPAAAGKLMGNLLLTGVGACMMQCRYHGPPRLFNPFDQTSLGQAVVFVGLVEVTMIEFIPDHDSSSVHVWSMVWSGALVCIYGRGLIKLVCVLRQVACRGLMLVRNLNIVNLYHKPTDFFLPAFSHIFLR